MKKLSLFLALASVSAGVVLGEAIDASEITKAPITSLNVFKNGSVLVEREVKPEKAGTLYLSGDIKPYHGTFWTKSEKPLKMTAFQETVTSNATSLTDERPLAERHGGHEATVWFTSNIPELEKELDFLQKEAGSGSIMTLQPNNVGKEEKLNTYKVTGVIEKPAKKSSDNKVALPPVTAFNGLVVRFASGGALRIPYANLVSVLADGENPSETSVSRKLWKVEGASGPFNFEYMTQGLTYAPYYRMELADGKAKLTMAADLRNEMEDFEEAEVALISGFPKIEMAGKDSLLNLGVSLNGFLNVLDSVSQPLVRNYKTQRAVSFASNRMAMDFDSAYGESAELGEVPQMNEAGAQNIHAQRIGKQTLKKGETLRTDIASANLEYKTKVKWTVANIRDVDQNGYTKNVTTNAEQTVWDVLCFKNPFSFPMTTAPMEVILNGTIYCQTPQTWLNPGQEGTTTLTKALSLEPKLEENEQRVENPKTLDIGSSRRAYQRIVDGKATLKNHRNEAVEAQIVLNVNGVFEKVEAGEGKEAGSSSMPVGINPLSIRKIDIEVPPNGTAEINYTYSFYLRD